MGGKATEGGKKRKAREGKERKKKRLKREREKGRKRKLGTEEMEGGGRCQDEWRK